MKEEAQVFLEEHGLDENEFRVLTYIIENPKASIDDLSSLNNGNKQETIRILNNLVDLAFVCEGAKSLNYWRASKKGLAIYDETNKLNLEMSGVILSHLIEIGSFANTIYELCGINTEWMRILAIIKAMNKDNGLTVDEICSYMENSDIELLRIKLKNKTDPEKIKRMRQEQRWIEVSIDKNGNELYSLSEAGEEAISLCIGDWQSRIA